MAAVINGTTCLYGVAGTATNLFVQSYTVSASFVSEDTVVDETGLTKTHRLDDRKTELTIEGIAKTSSPPTLGATIDFTTGTQSAYPSGAASTSFKGTITKIEERGGNKEFIKVSITAVDYEGITPA